MKPLFWTLCTLTLPVAAADFTLAPVKLSDGAQVFGTVSTDGTLGALAPAHITGWRVTVRQQTRYTFTPLNAPGVQVSQVGVSADGRKMGVATSPNGYDDGGILAFGSFGPWREYGVQVANFTGYYADGGASFYLAGAAFEWQWFGATHHSRRLVARAAPGSAVFKVAPVTYPSGTVLSGTVTTDGSTGVLTPAQIVDWNLKVQDVQDTVYDPSNSTLLPATAGLSTDGVTLWVARPGGYFGVGVAPRPPGRGQGAVMADFTDAAPRSGQAGYFNPFTFQYKGLHWREPLYPVGSTP